MVQAYSDVEHVEFAVDAQLKVYVVCLVSVVCVAAEVEIFVVSVVERQIAHSVHEELVAHVCYFAEVVCDSVALALVVVEAVVELQVYVVCQWFRVCESCAVAFVFVRCSAVTVGERC